MRVLCAWCEREGRPALLREDPPFDDPLPTHGVCDEHSAHLMAALTEIMRSWPTAGRPTVSPDAAAQ
jgi:hypothetical protein